MRMLSRLLGCLFILGCLAGLALQRPTVAEALAHGHAAEARGDWVQALAWYAQAHQQTPDDPAPLAAAARLRLAGGRADRAARDWNRAIALTPPAPDLWLLGGDIALAQHDPVAATNDYQRAITLAPASMAAHDAAVALARLALSAGNPSQVMTLVSAIPLPTPALRALQAIALAHQGEADAAQALLADATVARALAPEMVVALAGWMATTHDEAALGYADLTAGWPRLALGPLRRAVASQPGYGAGQAYLAWALWQAGDLAGAQGALAQAQRLAPDAPLTVGIAAQLRATAGDAPGALAALLAWQGSHPPAPELWPMQAQLAAQTGAWASEEAARWHLATTPALADHAALLDLAAFYLRTGLGTRDGRAQWAISAAVAANPTSVRAQDLLGQWDWQRGQPDAAVVALRAALARDPRSAAAHAHLALVAWGIGAGTTARSEATQALALDATIAALWRGTTLAAALTSDDSLAI